MLRYVGSLPFCVFGKAASLPPNTRLGEINKRKKGYRYVFRTDSPFWLSQAPYAFGCSYSVFDFTSQMQSFPFLTPISTLCLRLRICSIARTAASDSLISCIDCLLLPFLFFHIFHAHLVSQLRIGK